MVMSPFYEGPTFSKPNEVARITRPIQEQLGLEFVGYQRITHRGDFECIGSRPDWAESYLHQELYLRDPFLRHPKFFHTGKILLSDYQAHYGQAPTPCLRKYGIGTSLIFIERSATSVELFIFSISMEKESTNTILNEEEVLRCFMSYFRKESRALLNGLKPVNLLEVRGRSFEKGAPLHLEISPSARLKMLALLDDSLPYSLCEKLTPRERQCLGLLGQHLKYPEIASRLCLSPRTVEHYLENAKNRLGIDHREELLTLARVLLRIGFTLPAA